MAKTSSEVESDFIHTSESRTGRSVDEWISLLSNAGARDREEVFMRLRDEFGLNFMQAKLLTGIYFNGGKPVYGKS